MIQGQVRVRVYRFGLLLYYLLRIDLILVFDVILVRIESVVFLVVEFGLCQEVRVHRLEQLLLLRSLLELLVGDPPVVSFVNVCWRGRSALNDLMDQVSSLYAAFWRVVVTDIIYALLVPSECVNPIISSGHVLGRAFPLHEV